AWTPRAPPPPRRRSRGPGTAGTGAWRRGDLRACTDHDSQSGQEVATAEAHHADMTTDTQYVIEAEGLTKRFGNPEAGVQALAGLDLLAAAGQVTAVLGPNGAGK